MAEYMQAHVGEDAELYALGALDEAERRAVDAHSAQCVDCRRRIGEAEETVLALDRRLRPARPPAVRKPRVFSWYALAAAFLIGLLPSFYFMANRLNAQRVETTHGAAMLAMIGSHFAHAQFSATGHAPAPNAKVIFARDGAWLYVIVADRKRYEVDASEDGTLTPLGTTAPYDGTTELFVVKPPQSSAIVLRDRGVILARAAVATTTTPLRR